MVETARMYIIHLVNVEPAEQTVDKLSCPLSLGTSSIISSASSTVRLTGLAAASTADICLSVFSDII